MSVNRRPAGRARRAVAAWLLTFGLVGLAAGCGFQAQLNQPYTPADGTNRDIGTDGAIKVRNLVIISRAAGQGIVSASLIGNVEDQLTGVSVTPLKADGSAGTPATADLPSPIRLGGGSLTVLTNQELLTVSAPDLQPGLTASVTLQFAQAGAVALQCPVVDGTVIPWATISPTPSAGSSPSAGASPSGVPSPRSSASADPGDDVTPSPSSTPR